MSTESGLSIKDAHGRQISLLNDMSTDDRQRQQPQQQPQPQPNNGRRRYHCSEPGCNKSFTTSGHLARHNRIHTGEKNFHCLYPGCPSRFSRQDNMMQHYRTHMSPKSRRNPYHPAPVPASGPTSSLQHYTSHHHHNQPTAISERKVPQLHRHKHIRSDSNEHNLQPLSQSCLPPSSQRYQPYRKQQHHYPPPPITCWPNYPSRISRYPHPTSPPLASPPQQDATTITTTTTTATTTSSSSSSNNSSPSISFLCQPPPPSPPPMNYQHRHQIDSTRLNNDSHHPSPQHPTAKDKKDEDSELLQLAHIVSTFG